jgi:hypothetical protein
LLKQRQGRDVCSFKNASPDVPAGLFVLDCSSGHAILDTLSAPMFAFYLEMFVVGAQSVEGSKKSGSHENMT